MKTERWFMLAPQSRDKKLYQQQIKETLKFCDKNQSKVLGASMLTSEIPFVLDQPNMVPSDPGLTHGSQTSVECFFFRVWGSVGLKGGPIGDCRNVRGLGKSMVVFCFLNKVRY